MANFIYIFDKTAKIVNFNLQELFEARDVKIPLSADSEYGRKDKNILPHRISSIIIISRYLFFL